MAIVKKMNGTGGSTDGMFFHSFSGMPNDQYTPPFEDDPREHIGETFVIEVRAELTAVTTDEIKSGKREKLSFKVVDSKVGKMVTRADGSDSNQTRIDDFGDDEDDDGAGDYGDYGDEVEVGNLYADDEDAYDPAQDNPFSIVPDGDA